jgi:hypothetical protein
MATKNAATNLAVAMSESQDSALANAEESIARSRRLGQIIFCSRPYGYAFVFESAVDNGNFNDAGSGSRA